MAKQGYSWDAFISDNAINLTVPADDDVTLNNIPSSPTAANGTLNALNITGNITLQGPGSVAVQTMANNANGTYTFNNVNLTLNQGALPVTTINLTNASSFTATNSYNVNSNNGAFTVNFGTYVPGETNTLRLAAFANAVIVTNFKPGDLIDLVAGYDLSGIHLQDSGDGIVEVVQADGSPVLNGVIHTAKDPEGNYYKASDFEITKSSDGYEITCFLPGSMIRTPEGEVAVEDLRVGDEVMTFDWKTNTEISQPVIWAGHAHVTVRSNLPDDEAGWPVRILKDAISEGVPYKDMLVTSEHCLFFGNKFVPVRMLVNGVSIFYDKSIPSYTYYHIETEQHSVITADGVQTGSYLDTGNRSSFRQEGNVVTLRSKAKNWEEHAGAPLCVERAFVEPLFRALEERESRVSNCQPQADKKELTHDADLYLVTEANALVRPMRHAAGQYSFMLPPNTRAIRLVSRASRPSDVIGPFVDDRRFMGVAVGEVSLVSANRVFSITAHLQTEKPEGWHQTDETECAWTNGNALLPLGDHLADGKMGILTVALHGSGPYLVQEDKAEVKQQRSA